MLARTIRAALTAATVAALAACNHANAEKAAQLAADSARAEGASPAEVSRRANVARRAVEARDAANNPAKAAEKSRYRSAESGTALQLAAVTDISSRKNKAGDAFTARTTQAVLNSDADTVIPAGAELIGRVKEIKSAPHRGAPGTLSLELNTLRFNGQDYPIGVRVSSMATHIVSRGLTVDDAAKVGVGAAAGALAGKIIGRSTGAAAAGAVVGGAGGAVYANQTRDYDIALSPGAAISAVLTSSFTREVAGNH